MPSELTAGIEFKQDKLEDNMWGYHRTVDQKVNIGSAFLQNEWKNDHWGFLLGGRLDKHNLIDHIIFRYICFIRQFLCSEDKVYLLRQR